MTDKDIEKYFLSLYKKLLDVKYDLKITQKEFLALNSVNALINRQQAELTELKENHIPKVEAALKRANEIGRSVDLENEQLKAEIERLKENEETVIREFGVVNADKERILLIAAELSRKLKTAKAEAVKELAERLKEKYKKDFGSMWVSIYNPIEETKKEMVGEG